MTCPAILKLDAGFFGGKYDFGCPRKVGHKAWNEFEPKVVGGRIEGLPLSTNATRIQVRWL